MILEWTPYDYSPTYRIEVNENDFGFRRLKAVYDVPTCYPDAKELPINDTRRAFAEPSWNGGWQRKAMLRRSGRGSVVQEF